MKTKTLKIPSYLKNSYILDLVIIVIFVLTTIAINLQMIRYGLTGIVDIKWHVSWVQNLSLIHI